MILSVGQENYCNALKINGKLSPSRAVNCNLLKTKYLGIICPQVFMDAEKMPPDTKYGFRLRMRN